MKNLLFYGLIAIGIFSVLSSPESWGKEERESASYRLPETVLPVLGCWFWHEREFEPQGYRDFLDLVSDHSPYNYLTTSLRAPLKEVTDRDVHDQIQAAAIEARNRGIPLLMDLDVRLARRAFEKQYPDELQQMLILQEISLPGTGDGVVEVKSRDLNDHYTSSTTHYIPLQGSLLRVYGYQRSPEGIVANTLEEMTDACQVVEASAEVVRVRIPQGRGGQNRRACVMVSFTHLTPDVFAPHLLEFQRAILQQYRDASLAGACKDEWGFPPNFDGNPAKNEFWYSSHRAAEYARQTGRELLADCLLMSIGIQGRESERIAAINHFMEMSWQRNGAIEQDFYHAVKEILGATAVVATHPTWWPYPDRREFKKNGLHWWVAQRDWAQTDELTPFAVRTALAKKWKSPIWYNMFYSSEKANYEKSVWTHALAGGRINYHPLYPRSSPTLHGTRELLQGDLLRAENRVRLLNYITHSPLDCPVAVVFGHACAMNWVGPAYDDTGMEVANALWQAGYPADLIPSSEIESGNVVVNEEGWIQYGLQRYSALILYHPEFSKPSMANFLQKAASGNTRLFRVGDWTRDFEGNVLDGRDRLPETMSRFENVDSLVSSVYQHLQEKQIDTQTPALSSLEGFAHVSSEPAREGFGRLIDGTLVFLAGAHNVSGDPIQKNIDIRGQQVSFDAVGLFAIRLDAAGNLEALAAGSLKKFQLNEIDLSLPDPIDVVLWRDGYGEYHGVIQAAEREIPETLLRFTQDWRFLSMAPEAQ